MANARSLAQQFKEDGYVFVPGLLTSNETDAYRKKIQELSGLSDKDFDEKKARRKGWSMPDGVTRQSDWWDLIFHPRLIHTLRETLGPDVRYTQHSDLHVHHGAVGWHRDSACRVLGVGRDWDESHAPYQIARVGIYLQRYAESGSALGILPGTQRNQSWLSRKELAIHGKIRDFFKRPDWLFPLIFSRPLWFKTEPGDCLIFNQRLLHTGSHIHGPKYAIFLSYSPENHHAVNHRSYYLNERPELGYHDYHPALREKLSQAGLLLNESLRGKTSS